MKSYDKVYFIKIDGEKTYIGADDKKRLTLLTRDEAIFAAATTATPKYVETLDDLNNFYNIYRRPRQSNTLRNAGIAAAGLTAAGLVLVLGMPGSYALNSPDKASILGAFNAPKAVAERTIDVNQDQAPEAALETENTEENNETEKTAEVEERTFDSVLAESTSEKQKQVLSMMANYIRYFNGDFANTYKEVVELTDENGNLTGEKIEVKPALKWEYEVPALAIAYNGYSAQKLHSIFNGKDLNADQLDKDYKVATLQIFASYVISDRSKPVNLANLIESEEGKEFVQKYEDMFYSIKEAKTDEEKVELVTKFYQELHKDFPIDEVAKYDFSEEEVGIAHSDKITTFNGRELDTYKLGITPMICAVETMYQNLSIDPTLQDETINYFNLLGECNLAYKEFMKAEVASGCGEYDDTLADYDELSTLIIKELQDKNAYVIDDKHRELTLLTKFQENVNGHFSMPNGEMDGYWWYYTDTDTEVTVTYSDPTTRTETHTRYKKKTKEWETDDRDKAVNHVGEEAVEEAENKVKKEFEEENKKAKEKAEKEADKEQKKEQQEEDKKREQLEKEVEEEDKQFEQDINDANKQIEKNNDNDTTNDKPVNEDDFKGHEVDFDDDHSNSKGDLDDSVKDITTDGTGANEKLPDPNVTGEEFDSRTDSDPVEEKHEETKPAEEHHEEAKPAEEKHEESKPAEEHHEEAKPAEEKHEESKPAEEKHEESKPAEEKHEESKPAEEKHEESKPAEEKHEESKPAEEKHEESKPAEEKHEESKPAEEKHEESKPKEEHHEEAKPAEEKHEEAKPAEEKHEESHNDAPEEVHFESDDNDQYEEYTTTSSASDVELVDNYIASLEAATPEELAFIRRI